MSTPTDDQQQTFKVAMVALWICCGSSETLARSLGIITVACSLLYAVPPTSFVGAILFTGYLGGAIMSHVQIGGPLLTSLLFGLSLGLIAWNGLRLRDIGSRHLLPL